jgi:hypothetical protein
MDAHAAHDNSGVTYSTAITASGPRTNSSYIAGRAQPAGRSLVDAAAQLASEIGVRCSRLLDSQLHPLTGPFADLSPFGALTLQLAVGRIVPKLVLDKVRQPVHTPIDRNVHPGICPCGYPVRLTSRPSSQRPEYEVEINDHG